MKLKFILMNFLMLGCMISFLSCEKKNLDSEEKECVYYVSNQSSNDIIFRFTNPCPITIGDSVKSEILIREFDLKTNQSTTFSDKELFYPYHKGTIEVITNDMNFICNSNNSNKIGTTYGWDGSFFFPKETFGEKKYTDKIVYFKEIIFTDQVLNDLKNE